MKLVVRRDVLTKTSTTGKLYVDGTFECYTLEDRIRDKKVAGKTAIPMGTYEVRITHSPRFGKDMPLLMNVPGFSGIRIHPGNTAEDTEGCLLVGQTRSENFIGNSRAAYKALFAKLKAAQDAKEFIEIELVVEVPAQEAVPSAG